MTHPVVGRPFFRVAYEEGKRHAPFMFGFAVTLGIIVKMSLGLKPEDAQKSPFVNVNAHR